jgi:excisionase family DNA binding protein
VKQVSVAEAAKRLGVGVARVHQRIADGSVRARRVGSQWVVDEASLPLAAERSRPGRPLSQRSAWALLAVSQANQRVLGALAPSERSRARDRLDRLLARALSEDAVSEDQIHSVAALLRSLLRNRATRCLYRASPRDLPDLRKDHRVTLSGVSHPRGGLASGDLVEGYIAADDLDAVVDGYLLSSVAADSDANVVWHVVPVVVQSRIEGVAPLLLAADLAEHCRPREEARAAELLREMLGEHPGTAAQCHQGGPQHRKALA